MATGDGGGGMGCGLEGSETLAHPQMQAATKQAVKIMLITFIEPSQETAQGKENLC